MPTKPTKTVNQAKRPHRELIALKEEPRYQVPSDDPEWFARYMGEYTGGLRQTLERMQERIEQLEGHRGNPEIQADLSMLGNAIKDVKDPVLKETQNVVTVQFLLTNALVKNAQGEYTLNGTLNANGQVITNLGRSRLSFDPQTTAEILAMVLAILTTTLPTTVQAGDMPLVGTENKGARGDHRHGVSTGDAADLSTIQAGDGAAGGSSLDLPRADHQHAVATGDTADVVVIQAGDTTDGGTSFDLPRADHRHGVSTAPDVVLSTIQAGDAATSGTSQTLPRGDHQHAVDTAGSGDIAPVATTAAAGISARLPRADHVHSGVALTTAQTVGGEKTFSAKTTFNSEVEIGGTLNHGGAAINFFGVAPAARASSYTITNGTTDRGYDANSFSIDELADVLYTLIQDLTLYGLLQ